MRKIKKIFVHCTASGINSTAKGIQNYFLRDKKDEGRGWRTGGYHKMVDRDGKVTTFYEDGTVTNGVKRYNKNSLHISWVGGFNSVDNRTRPQRRALKREVIRWLRKYPTAKVYGHRDFSLKSCPNFDLHQEWGIGKGTILTNLRILENNDISVEE